MANQRYIHDVIWTDAYFQELSPQHKLLFIYLLTNEHLEISGIYQITPKTIANETGLSNVPELIQKLMDDGKLLYEDNVVGIINYQKHNGIWNNPKYQVAIRKSIKKLEPEMQEKFCLRLGIDRESIGNPEKKPTADSLSIGNTETAPKLNQSKLNQIKLNQDNPPTPQKTPKPKGEDDPKRIVELAPGILMTNERAHKFRTEYGDDLFLSIPEAVSEWAERKGIMVDDGYKMCVKFAAKELRNGKA